MKYLIITDNQEVEKLFKYSGLNIEVLEKDTLYSPFEAAKLIVVTHDFKIDRDMGELTVGGITIEYNEDAELHIVKVDDTNSVPTVQQLAHTLKIMSEKDFTYAKQIKEFQEKQVELFGLNNYASLFMYYFIQTSTGHTCLMQSSPTMDPYQRNSVKPEWTAESVLAYDLRENYTELNFNPVILFKGADVIKVAHQVSDEKETVSLNLRTVVSFLIPGIYLDKTMLVAPDFYVDLAKEIIDKGNNMNSLLDVLDTERTLNVIEPFKVFKTDSFLKFIKDIAFPHDYLAAAIMEIEPEGERTARVMLALKVLINKETYVMSLEFSFEDGSDKVKMVMTELIRQKDQYNFVQSATMNNGDNKTEDLSYPMVAIPYDILDLDSIISVIDEMILLLQA